MEGRVSRGRGGSWKRGGRGGHDGSSAGGGEHRGRGRGGHHRGRGKRDHRGRGRGGGGEHGATFQHREQNEGDSEEDEENTRENFSRRKLESNWDRYEASEKADARDEDMPTQRGADFQVLLESAGDSFSQFRFQEEKDWEMDSFTVTQIPGAIVDLAALALTLQQLPLHQRLNLEPELVQVLTPVDLPSAVPAPKQDVSKASSIAPLSESLTGTVNQKTPSSPNPVSSSKSKNCSEQPLDDGDEELDLLLRLEKPTLEEKDDESPAENACEEKKEVTQLEVKEEKEEVKEKSVAPPASFSKQEMSEEDLEDWLDSMIS